MVASHAGQSVSLADVLPSCLASVGVEGYSNTLALPPSRLSVVVLVDGLGAINLANMRGHARFLAQCDARGSLTTIFPSTTASALASFATGVSPAVHGVLGYRVWNPTRREMVNQLSGIDASDIHDGWLASPSLIARHASTAKSVVMIGHPRFRHSTLTNLLYGDAHYVPAASFAEKLTAAKQLMDLAHSSSALDRDYGVIFIYVSELDEAAHRWGVDSFEWRSLLEECDAFTRALAEACPEDVTALLVADHGVLDVASVNHIDFGLGREMDGVREIGGEPRCLQIYLAESEVRLTAMAAWADLVGSAELVWDQRHVENDLWRGRLAETLQNRAPDFWVFAPRGHALYDARLPRDASRRMIGQHGGLSEDEMRIPLIVLNAATA